MNWVQVNTCWKMQMWVNCWDANIKRLLGATEPEQWTFTNINSQVIYKYCKCQCQVGKEIMSAAYHCNWGTLPLIVHACPTRSLVHKPRQNKQEGNNKRVGMEGAGIFLLSLHGHYPLYNPIVAYIGDKDTNIIERNRITNPFGVSKNGALSALSEEPIVLSSFSMLKKCALSTASYNIIHTLTYT